MSRPCTLYRFFDVSGRLLYVGITIKPWQRFTSHKVNKPWWFDAERIHLEHYRSEREAREAETRAIHNEKPLFNAMSQRESGPWPWDFEVIVRAEPVLGAIVSEAMLMVDCPYCDGRWDRWELEIRKRIGVRRNEHHGRANETVSTKAALDAYLTEMEAFYVANPPTSSIERILSQTYVDGWFVAVLSNLIPPCDRCLRGFAEIVTEETIR